MMRYAVDVAATAALTEAVSSDVEEVAHHAGRVLAAATTAANALGTLRGVVTLVESVTSERADVSNAATDLGRASVRAVRAGVLAYVAADETMASATTAESAALDEPIRGRGFSRVPV